MIKVAFILMLFASLVATWAAPVIRPFADYQVILNRKPFGAPPERMPEPERVIPPGESFAAQLILSGIYELDDGNLRVAVTDRKDNSYFSLMVEETDDTRQIKLVDADYDKAEAVLQKGDQLVVLKMYGDSSGGGTQVLSTTEKQDRMKQAEERRMSYAERRRIRQLERQKPLEIPKPILTGKELEEHLQNYQMKVIREGMPPLPVQLTPERDAQLVQEGYLPPLDEEGYEIDLEAEEEEYYENGE